VSFHELRENCSHEYCENWQRRVEQNKNITTGWVWGRNDEWLTDSLTLNKTATLVTANRDMDPGGREVSTAKQKENS
jgi:hypothetical protein